MRTCRRVAHTLDRAVVRQMGPRSTDRSFDHRHDVLVGSSVPVRGSTRRSRRRASWPCPNVHGGSLAIMSNRLTPGEPGHAVGSEGAAGALAWANTPPAREHVGLARRTSTCCACRPRVDDHFAGPAGRGVGRRGRLLGECYQEHAGPSLVREGETYHPSRDPVRGHDLKSGSAVKPVPLMCRVGLIEHEVLVRADLFRTWL